MIKYKKRKKYKYNLHSDKDYSTKIHVKKPKTGKFLEINAKGELKIIAGYSWDGPSGPTIDTKNFMQGSLVHDALYQLMREGHIEPNKTNRKKADKILRDICREDGMSRMRAWWVYRGVRLGGEKAVKPDLLTAP